VKPPFGLVNSEFLMVVHFWLSKYHPALLGYEELNPDIRPKHDEKIWELYSCYTRITYIV
jgi:hypothetical protein